MIEAVGCFYHFWSCQELRPSLTEEDIQRGRQKKELNALGRHYVQEKVFEVIEMWECEWWRLYKTTITVKNISENTSLSGVHLQRTNFTRDKGRKVFGFVQCDIEGLENLRSKLVNFPPIFKNTLVSKGDIGDLLKNYAEEEKLLSQPQKMLITSFTLQYGTLITPLLLLYLQLGLVVTEITVLLSTLQRNVSTALCIQQ